MQCEQLREHEKEQAAQLRMDMDLHRTEMDLQAQELKIMSDRVYGALTAETPRDEPEPIDLNAADKSGGADEGAGKTSSKSTSSIRHDVCWNCGKKGHCWRDCWKPGGGAPAHASPDAEAPPRAGEGKRRRSKRDKQTSGRDAEAAEIDEARKIFEARDLDEASERASTLGGLTSLDNIAPYSDLNGGVVYELSLIHI